MIPRTIATIQNSFISPYISPNNQNGEYADDEYVYGNAEQLATNELLNQSPSNVIIPMETTKDIKNPRKPKK